MCPPERPHSGVSIPKIHALCAEANDGCAPAGRHGRAHRHRPYQSPSYFSTQSHTNKITIYAQSTPTRPTIHASSTKRNQSPTRNLPKRNRRGEHPRAILSSKMRRGGACVPARTSAQRRFHTKNTRIVRWDERRMCPWWATRAGTQAPPLPRSVIFFHTIPYKQNNHLHAIHPNNINRPYPSPPNHAVRPYPIGIILSIAQGWQVQRSLPCVTMQARRLPPWGLYFFSSHIITTHGEWMISPHAN